MSKKEQPHLILAIYPGASSIKTVGSIAGDDKCHPLIIEPCVASFFKG